MKLVLVNNPIHALAVAMIRNECREYMTHDTRELSVKRQLKFYDQTLIKKRIYVFIAIHKGMPIGYALIRILDNKLWITGGLAKGFRGKGLGTQLFKEILIIAQTPTWQPVWLEVKRSNKRAIRLYLKLGFKIIRSTKRLLVMNHA